MSEHFIIIGAGQAACQAAASLRSEGFSGRLTLIGDELQPPYQRPPLSKKYLSAEISSDRLYLKPPAFYAKNEIELMLGVRAEKVDPSSKTVALSSGTVLSYRKLLIATGSSPRRLAIPGAELKGVCYMRSISDVAAFREKLFPGARLVIVGGGYIGLEAAAACVRLGVSVHVIEAAPKLLARVAGPEISEFFLNIHRARGVGIRLDATVAEFFGREGRVTGIGLSGGEELATDAVLVGIGAIPNSDLAAQAGLAVADGIVVDEHARTSDRDILAAGDCTMHPNSIYGRTLRLESVHNAIEQAKIAAASMNGKLLSYTQVPWFWSDQFEFKLQVSGLVQGADERRVSGHADRSPFSVHHYREGRLVAVEAVDAAAQFMAAKARILADHRDLAVVAGANRTL